MLAYWFRAKSPRRGDELTWWQQLNVDPLETASGCGEQARELLQDIE
jgi:hypothetical protein